MTPGASGVFDRYFHSTVAASTWDADSRGCGLMRGTRQGDDDDHLFQPCFRRLNREQQGEYLERHHASADWRARLLAA